MDVSTVPTVQKLFIQMSGAPGSGKSTVASLLAKSLDCVIINHDRIKSFFLENNIPFREASKLVYSFDWVLAEDLLKQGRSVILDSTCNYDETLLQGTNLASRYNRKYIYIECRVNDIDLLDRRLAQRESLCSQRTGVNQSPDLNSGADNSAEDSKALFIKWIESPCRPSDDSAIIVDATLPPADCLDYILERIGKDTEHHQSIG
ncbi:hypothetical protein H072_10449 [Dactylellina haptotyla CBS 200.50]|uniref:Zeta toxin domain-containing protein n=1 Tax=Dactylellina haptotyla (strain CBS 200.50) TaxID=1284197 RepID=S8BLD9_DACHA|nr:hypothetical protein H072_10449 [Dactylellina haptotyla CBS 200.50]